MKSSYFVTKNIFLVLLLVGLCSCGNEIRIETILEDEDATGLSASDKEVVVKQLKSRFSDGAYGEVTVEAIPRGVRVVTAVKDTGEEATQELDAYFGSVSVGLYDAVNLSDPAINLWLSGVELPQDVYRENSVQFGGNRNVLLQAQDGTDFNALRFFLKETMPQDKGYIMFWSLPGQLQGTVADYGRSLHLYKSSKDTGGPRMDNSSISSAKYLMTEYGDPAIEAQFTEAGTADFGRMTTEASHDNNRTIGIVIDEEVWTNPSVQGPITGGSVWITGGLENSKLGPIAQQLAWEPLPVKLKVSARRILPNE